MAAATPQVERTLLVRMERPAPIRSSRVTLRVEGLHNAEPVALAEQLGVRVEGIDAFHPFLQAARALATERGVSHRCRFEQGDIRDRRHFAD